MEEFRSSAISIRVLKSGQAAIAQISPKAARRHLTQLSHSGWANRRR
jgi:predicted ArsR family transcriptional regulator